MNKKDKIIIDRIIRTPERAIYNIDIGNASKEQAERYIKKLQKNLRKFNE